MSEQLSAYRQFAENLRHLCLQKGTIADVCRDLGINRQQFNKYLAGAALPNPKTLSKIAEYFGKDQVALFQDEKNQQRRRMSKLEDGLAMLAAASPSAIDVINATIADSVEVPIREGCYIIYYPWILDPDQLVRAVLLVYKLGELTCFRRYTRLHSKGASMSRPYPKGRHEGLVLSTGKQICMLGKNSVGFGELSIQVFNATSHVDEDVLTGLSLVSTPWEEPCALRVTISYFGPPSYFRKALRLAHSGLISKDEVSEFIRKSVTEPLKSRIPQIRPYDVYEWLRLNEDQA